MTWTPLITSSMFTGITTDCLTATTGLMGLALIVLGIGVIYRVFAH